MGATHPEFLWIVVLSGITSVVLSMVIGANDVANAFAASVGSGTLTLEYAIAMAFVFEILGALLLGGTVTDAIRKKVLNFEAFRDAPLELALGMFTASFGAAAWLLVATWLGMPVSTTHSIIGALAGFGVASGRVDSVKWMRVVYIIVSWVCLPFVALIIAPTLYILLQELIIKRLHSFKILLNFNWVWIALQCVPLAMLVAFENPLVKVKNNIKYAQWFQQSKANRHLLIGLIFGLLFMIMCSVSYVVVFRRIKNKWSHHKCDRKLVNIFTRHLIKWYGNFCKSPRVLETQGTRSDDKSGDPLAEPSEEASNEAKGNGNASGHRVTVQVEPTSVLVDADGQVSTAAGKEEENVDSDEHKCEVVFSALQIIGAFVVIVAHSANDTANAVTAFSTVLLVYKNGIETKVEDTPWYILLCGGCCMSLGLALLGYRVIRTVALDLFRVTPSRGFIVDTTVGNLIILACHLGIPVSSTQCTVSSTLGVGLVGNVERRHGSVPIIELDAEGDAEEAEAASQGSAGYWHRKGTSKFKRILGRISTRNVSLVVFKKIIVSWVSTMILSGIISATLYVVLIFVIKSVNH